MHVRTPVGGSACDCSYRAGHVRCSLGGLDATMRRSFRIAGPLRRDPVNPRRHRGGGGDATPLRFFWNIFFVNRSIVTIFFYSFPPIFYVPPENFKTLTP